MWFLVRTLGRLAAAVLVAGLLSATLLRFAPGLGVDEGQLDVRWRQEQAGWSAAAGEMENLPRFYIRFIGNYLRGDLGRSRLLDQPVAGLVRERLPATAAATGIGLAAGWTAALALSLLAVRYRGSPGWGGAATASSLLLQCIPAAVLGLLLLLAGGRGAMLCGAAIGLMVYSRMTPLLRSRLDQAAGMPHVLTAKAQGAGEWRVLVRQVLPVSMPEITAAAGVSVSLALSVAIPLETALDIPGLGQLAWQAALGRDVYLLLNLTALLSVVVLAANAVADWAIDTDGNGKTAEMFSRR